jgi:hypothetical protein
MANLTLPEPAVAGKPGRSGLILGISIGMLPCIALAAVFVPHFQFSVLYAIPLTLLACSGRLRAMHWVTALVLVLCFVTYFLKYYLDPPIAGAQYLSFRIVNRMMVAGMLWLLSRVLGLWLEVENDRQDAGQSGEADYAPTQISTMLGMLIVMPAVVVVVLLDGITPGHYNLAVLYVVPLVASAWVRSERLLWSLCALLEVLAIGGLYWGPPPDANEDFNRFLLSRIFNGVVMFVVAGLLSYWMRTTPHGGPPNRPADRRDDYLPADDDEPSVIR